MANQTDPAAFPAAWQATYSDHSSQERIQKDAQSIVSFLEKYIFGNMHMLWVYRSTNFYIWNRPV